MAEWVDYRADHLLPAYHLRETGQPSEPREPQLPLLAIEHTKGVGRLGYKAAFGGGGEGWRGARTIG